MGSVLITVPAVLASAVVVVLLALAGARQPATSRTVLRRAPLERTPAGTRLTPPAGGHAAPRSVTPVRPLPWWRRILSAIGIVVMTAATGFVVAVCVGGALALVVLALRQAVG